ncbi:hypothetical protein DFAR_1080004 [Desulfarculales bacterium]
MIETRSPHPGVILHYFPPTEFAALVKKPVPGSELRELPVGPSSWPCSPITWPGPIS